MGAEVGVVGGGCSGEGREGRCGDGLSEAVLTVAADDVREVGDRLDRDALLAVVAISSAPTMASDLIDTGVKSCTKLCINGTLTDDELRSILAKMVRTMKLRRR